MNQNDVRLEHVFLHVRDIDRTLAFYGLLMPGWIVRWQGNGRGDRRWIHFGPPGDGQPGYLSLCEHHDPEARRPHDEALGIKHVGFAHRDVDALVERMATAGVRPTERTSDARYRRVYFADPDGHQIELVEAIV